MFVTYALTVRTLSTRNARTIATSWRDQFRWRASPWPNEIRTITVSSSSNEQNQPARAQDSTPRQGPQKGDFASTESQLTVTGSNAAGENAKESFVGFQGSQADDDIKTLRYVPSMPELVLIRQIARVGTLQPIDERIRYTASHPLLVTVSTTFNNDNGDDENKEFEEARRQQRTGSDETTTVRQPAGQKRQNNDYNSDDDDDEKDDDDDVDYIQMRLRQRESCRRNHVAATVVVPVIEDTERPETSTKTLTDGTRNTLHADVETRHDDDADNDVKPRCHHTVKQTSTEAPHSKAILLRTGPDIKGCGMVRTNPTTTAARGPSTSGNAKRKATRVLGVMFVVFVVLWTPFFVLNLLSAVCPGCVQSVATTVWTVLVWLGWVSSLANPIIYTSFSPAFRAAFRRLLTCRGRRGVSLAKHRQQQWTSHLRRRQLPTSSNQGLRGPPRTTLRTCQNSFDERMHAE